jgi:hypothetical protein
MTLSNRRKAVSAVVVGVVILVALISGAAGYYLATVITGLPTTEVGTTTSTNGHSSSTSMSSTSTTSTTLVSTEAQSTYNLNQQDAINLGWSLEEAYTGPAGNPKVADSFTLVVKNTGGDSITGLSFEVGGLGTVTASVPISPSSSETMQDIFVGVSCGTTDVGFCPKQATLNVNVTYSDGKSFSIPQPIDIQYNASTSPFTYDTSSAYCTSLLSTISSSDIQVSLANSYLEIRYSGSTTASLAAFTIFDPLNSNGLRVSGILGFTLSPSSNNIFVSIGSPNFISGKQYSIWIQLGQPSSVSKSIIYSPDGFCTVSLTLQG